jgi:hypothetical protein
MLLFATIENSRIFIQFKTRDVSKTYILQSRYFQCFCNKGKPCEEIVLANGVSVVGVSTKIASTYGACRHSKILIKHTELKSIVIKVPS